MKKLFTLMAIVFIIAGLSAQSPEKMSYQAVVRDGLNKLVTNHAVGIRISIIRTSASGTVVYKETQSTTTNLNGLATIEIGTGTSTDVFSSIDWSKGPYFVKTEIDPSGGSSYSITATTQLLSVPYALYAKDVLNKQWTESSTSIYYNTGKVGIGTNPGADLRQFQVLTANNQAIAGVNNGTYPTIYAQNNGSGPAAEFRNKIKIVDGTQSDGKVLTSDASGISSWQTPLYSQWQTNGSNISFNTGKVGIGVVPGTDARQLEILTASSNAIFAKNNSGSYYTIYARNEGTGAAGYFINNSAGTYALYARNENTGPAAYFDGSLQVSGGNNSEINRSQTGAANIVPVGYGSVEANGTKNIGGSTTNFSVTKVATGVYDISLTSETYSQTTHCAMTSLGDPGFINSNEVSGKLRIYTYNTANVATDREFSFVVYKP